MEEVLSALVAIKKELDEQRLEIRDTGKNVTEQVTHNINTLLEEKFKTWEHKHEILKEIVEDQEKRLYFLEKQEKKRNLVFFGIVESETEEDYPKQVLQKRRELQEQVKMEREKGTIVKIKYDKLVILKPNQKRQLHTSPTNDSQTQSDASSNVNKKNKVLKTHSSVRRSNSVSESVLKPSMLNFLVNKKVSNTTPEQDIENREKNL
ncbi:unnamed protein product [Euphydryas editha]|uniref:Uncharacterized protein n=1 Tax=Euphydryas editha TaxID=104508 RepID=A0AAU9TDS5_EUPED|nr:unnamed protein product [Euphydryas editha]